MSRELEIAWTYRTGELGEGFARADKLAVRSHADPGRDTLYLSTPTNIVIALDPATGRERWRYDPNIRARRALLAKPLRAACPRGSTRRPNPTAAVLASHLHRHARRAPDRARRPHRTACADFGAHGSVDLAHGRATRPSAAIIS